MHNKLETILIHGLGKVTKKMQNGTNIELLVNIPFKMVMSKITWKVKVEKDNHMISVSLSL